MKHRLCPVWLGCVLASPLRKLVQNPLKILGPYVKPGMKVMDIGSAMGFFSLPLAELVGETGRVVCVDLQAGMLNGLMKRAQRAGLDRRMEMRLCTAESLEVQDLAGQMDFAMTFAVVHETPDPDRFIKEAASVLKSGGRLLIAEPTGHVSKTEFEKTIATAERAGVKIVSTPVINHSLAVLLARA